MPLPEHLPTSTKAHSSANWVTSLLGAEASIKTDLTHHSHLLTYSFKAHESGVPTHYSLQAGLLEVDPQQIACTKYSVATIYQLTLPFCLFFDLFFKRKNKCGPLFLFLWSLDYNLGWISYNFIALKLLKSNKCHLIGQTYWWVQHSKIWRTCMMNWFSYH